MADAYDVVALLRAGGTARLRLGDDSELIATYSGAFDGGGLARAAVEAELSTCDACFLDEDKGGGLRRLRITETKGGVKAGGVTTFQRAGRRVRWDLYLAE